MDWLLSAPVWIQTPIVTGVLLLICAPVARAMYALSTRIMPLSDQEKRIFSATYPSWDEGRRDEEVKEEELS